MSAVQSATGPGLNAECVFGSGTPVSFIVLRLLYAGEPPVPLLSCVLGVRRAQPSRLAVLCLPQIRQRIKQLRLRPTQEGKAMAEPAAENPRDEMTIR